ncbi:MAG: hypothetical protein JXB32_02920 [Deltaproteobacteria bacterium]|nr:hypothetical protein [Deltaproteobacteria bacterium]
MFHSTSGVVLLICSGLMVSSAFGSETASGSAGASASAKQQPLPTDSGAAGCRIDADCGAGRICFNSACVGISMGDSSQAVPVEEAQTMPGVLGLLSAGPVFENSYGGFGFNLSLAAGGSGSYFTVGIHLRAGARWEDDDPKVEPGVELGYRYMTQLPSGMVPHFVLVLGDSHLTQFDEQFGTVYHWNIPHVRIGGGLMWGGFARTKFGFEACYFGGYAFHTNQSENPWGQVYEWPYNGGHIHFIMTF